MSSSPRHSAYPALPPPVRVPLHVLPAHSCNYLPEQTTTLRALWAAEMNAEIYQGFMDAGFRRSGRMIYQPICQGCRACVPLRVPVDRFAPNKSQRRCWKRNGDLAITIGPAEPTEEKFDLYTRYRQQWFESSTFQEPEEWVQFLYDSPVPTEEFCYRDPAGRLLAVGICDLTRAALSSVYFYHDPAHAHRGLGTFGALVELDFARRRGIPYYYLGYWIGGCREMSYKANFKPYEVLGLDGIWRPGDEIRA